MQFCLIISMMSLSDIKLKFLFVTGMWINTSVHCRYVFVHMVPVHVYHGHYTHSAFQLCLIPFRLTKFEKVPFGLTFVHVTRAIININSACVMIRVAAQVNQMVLVWFLSWLFFSCHSESPSPGCLLHPQMIVWCTLPFKIIPFSGDSSRTGHFCTLQWHTPLSILLLRVNRLPLKIRAGCPLVVVMNSMVDCNKMSIAANSSRTFNLHTSCIITGVDWLMQMGPFHISFDKMGQTKWG